MATISDEDCIPQEETGKRRTRSGRKSSVQTTPPSTRTTRRSARKKSEPEIEQVDSSHEEEHTENMITSEIFNTEKTPHESAIEELEMAQEMLPDMSMGSKELSDMSMVAQDVNPRMLNQNIHSDMQGIDFGNQEINMDNQEYHMGGNQEFHMGDNQEFHMSGNQEYQMVGNQEFHMDNQELNMGNQELQMDNQEIHLSNQETHMGNQRMHMGNQEMHMDNLDMHLDNQEINLDNQDMHSDNQEICVSMAQVVQDEKSSSFPFGTAQSSDLTALYDQSSTGADNMPPRTDAIDNLLANLAEDNANSLPSGGDDTEFTLNMPEQADNVITTMPTLEDEIDAAHQQEQLQQESLHQPLKQDQENEQVPYQYNEQVADQEKEMRPNQAQEKTQSPKLEQQQSEEILENISFQVLKEHVTENQEVIVEEQQANVASDISEPAIAEILQNGDNSDATITNKEDLDAEMVSEDELPVVTQPKVDDAEEVSDEELPGPKMAELPADTEVVSEDELPASNKKRKVDEGYDPGSPTESSEAPEKKSKVEDEEVDAEKKKEKKEEKEKEKKPLPDLEKYWKAVKDDPTDFTGWTYLLQYVDQENDIESAREAYDAFLLHYPYCYGYWRKYADYEKRKGNKKYSEEVFERGLKAIPLSVDLWIHYLTHVKLNYVDDEQQIRSQFERALTACGLEFRSDKLWEAYIKWETEGKHIQNVVSIYDRLLETPTQGYNGHFDSFQEIINNNSIMNLIPVEKLKKLRTEVRESENKDVTITETTEDPTIAPGEEEPDDHLRNEEEQTAIKDKILVNRRKIHKNTIAAVTARWTFEEGIKRPYFHVKPLERCQLKNWKEYLDFEIEQGDRKRVLVLFERCLIACALYEEFWLKLVRYLESENDTELEEKTREVYERACTVHHPDKPSLHLMWSAFEECHDNAEKAAEILTNLEQNCPNMLQIAYRRINLERRRKNFDKCADLYDHYISTAKNKNIAGSLAIKYARFFHKIKGDLDGGIEILKSTLERDPANTRVALQMIDLALQRSTVNEPEIIKIMDNFMDRDGIEPDQKVLFAQRKVEFLEDFGSTAKGLQDAQRALQLALTKANEAKKKVNETNVTKKSKDTLPSQQTTSNYSGTYANYGSGGNSNYYGNTNQYNSQPYAGGGSGGGGGGGSGGGGAGGGGPGEYGYNQWQPYGSNYSGYGQWGGYNSGGYY